MCDWTCSWVFPLVFSPRISPCSSCSSRDSLLSWKIGPLGFYPTSSWYHEPRWSQFRSLPSLFSSLILLCSSPISKIPTKNSPNFFVICWFDKVLLDLIHGFAWFQVDLASPQVSPSFTHEISSVLTPKSPNSAQNRAPDLASRVDPDPPDDRQFTDDQSP